MSSGHQGEYGLCRSQTSRQGGGVSMLLNELECLHSLKKLAARKQK